MSRKHKKSPLRRARRHHLTFAVKWLGLGSIPKREVFAAVANALEVSHPETVDAGYSLLETFETEFRRAKRPAHWHPSKRREASSRHNVNSDAFLLSFEWRQLRMKVLKARGARCECCGFSAKDGVKIHVDHIKSRRRHPELALDITNLQVLCEVCNHGKGAWDETDWRADSQTSGESSKDSPVTRSGDGDGHVPVATFPRLIRKRLGNIRG